MYQQKKITSNNIDISYLEWSTSTTSNDSEPILLLHGMADNCLVWKNFGSYFSDRHDNRRIIAPDLRGHGDSSKPDTGYFYGDYFADLEAIYEHFNWQKVNIVAHSWSAKIACLWATQHPDRCQSLVLIDPFFINSMPSIFKLSFPLLYKVLPFLKLMQSFPDYESAQIVGKSLKQYQGWTSWQKEIFDYGMEEKADRTWSSKFSIPARNEIFIDVMKQKGLSKKLDIPSLLVLPENGLNRSSWQIKPYEKYLTNLQKATVKGNHWAFVVEPDDFNKTIENFLLKMC